MNKINRLIYTAALVVAVAPAAHGESSLSPGSAQSFERIFGAVPLPEPEPLVPPGAEFRALRTLSAQSAADASPLPAVLSSFVQVVDAPPEVQRLLDWNAIALSISGIDHYAVMEAAAGPDTCARFSRYEQTGPHRTSRAMAMVHLAMFEAVNALFPQYQSALATPIAMPPLDEAARNGAVHYAIAYAANDVLAALYPAQADGTLFNARITNMRDLRELPDDPTAAAAQNPIGDAGRAIGRAAAAAVIASRSGDKANQGNESSPRVEPILEALTDCDLDVPVFTPASGTAKWRMDPISRLNVALGANWDEVRPFALPQGADGRVASWVRLPDPMSLNRFEAELAEVREIGMRDSPTRTTGETLRGLFWAYDGVPQLCAPPALYNQVVTTILQDHPMRSDLAAVARLYALVNLAMADTAIAAWDAKFEWQLARPVTAIRDRLAEEIGFWGSSGDGTDVATLKGDVSSAPPTIPVAAGGAGGTEPGAPVGEAGAAGDPCLTEWCPLGAPATNGRGPNFTPPFPAYPSGHAAFGGALFEVLRLELGDRPFTLVSGEFDGTNRPATRGEAPETAEDRERVLIPPRDLVPLSYASFAEAERENARSRIWLGIHYQMDGDSGILMGNCVARYVAATMLRPLGETPSAAAPDCGYAALSRP